MSCSTFFVSLLLSLSSLLLLLLLFWCGLFFAHPYSRVNTIVAFLPGSDWVNPEDPNVIAENELLGAASAIEAAARKLAELKPRERPRVST